MVQEKTDKKAEKEVDIAPKEEQKPLSAAEGLQGIVALLEKSVKLKDTRLLMGRLMRQTALVRKHLTGADLTTFLKASLPEGDAQAALLRAVEQVGALEVGSRGTYASSHGRACGRPHLQPHIPKACPRALFWATVPPHKQTRHSCRWVTARRPWMLTSPRPPQLPSRRRRRPAACLRWSSLPPCWC